MGDLENGQVARVFNEGFAIFIFDVVYFGLGLPFEVVLELRNAIYI